MRILQLKRLYLPALSIIAVVLILLVLISVSTYRNMQREEKTVLKMMHQQGLALIFALEAGARTGMQMPGWQENAFEYLIIEFAKNEDIGYIYIIDTDGIVVHHSNPAFTGMSSAWRPRLDGVTQSRGRVRKLPDG